MQRSTPPSDRPQRSCPLCGAPMRASHREYAGQGMRRQVYRCTRCGGTDTGAARDESSMRPQPRSRKPLPDEGSPDNTVLDEETARRLREMLGG